MEKTPFFNVIYEDNHLLVLDKPAGLLTQSTDQEQESLEFFAREWLKEKYNKKGEAFLHPIHRLDRLVCGLVLFAKSSKALSRLQKSMKNREIQKVYRAFVGQKPLKDVHTLEHYLLHGSHKALVVDANIKGAKRSSLSYRVLENSRKGSLLEVELHTGRYHQIRVQLAFMGCPIIGDVLYGSLEPYQSKAIALQHYQLTFEHPTTKKKCIFFSSYCLQV